MRSRALDRTMSLTLCPSLRPKGEHTVSDRAFRVVTLILCPSSPPVSTTSSLGSSVDNRGKGADEFREPARADQQISPRQSLGPTHVPSTTGSVVATCIWVDDSGREHSTAQTFHNTTFETAISLAESVEPTWEGKVIGRMAVLKDGNGHVNTMKWSNTRF